MEAAELMKITSHELLEMEVVDKVISESGLTSKDLLAHVKNELELEVERLKSMPIEKLLEERYQRFRKILKRKLELENSSSFLASIKYISGLTIDC